MSPKTKVKTILKKEKSNHEKEISSLKRVMREYKVETKVNWKSFKDEMDDDIDKNEKSYGKLTKNKRIKINQNDNR